MTADEMKRECAKLGYHYSEVDGPGRNGLRMTAAVAEPVDQMVNGHLLMAYGMGWESWHTHCASPRPAALRRRILEAVQNAHKLCR